MKDMINQQGQVILILILVMTVGLGIGISVVQRSLSDVSTASKVEQSSRAFSAAEAGIERAINTGATGSLDLGNNSLIQAVEKNDIPASGQALEYPPLAKEETATVWLADYTSASNPPPAVYTHNTLDIYWGNSSSDKAALSLTLVYHDGSKYQPRKWYLDHNLTRSPDNNFEKVDCTGYTLGSNNYQCYKRLEALPSGLILIRARLLYNTTSQPFAVKPTSGDLPVQARLFTATGVSGETQRKIQVFRLDKVVPSFFDYAIFSAGDINK